ncbi:cytochrome-c peroxidase [Chitinophaga defluvii]|uniref:Cytochrome c peroxidase n=1 Tax=Chitinophaga defluvii TaxID=3163343 RepID=A0ABV2T224_9BACT
MQQYTPKKQFYAIRLITGFLVVVSCLVGLLSLSYPSSSAIGLAPTIAYYKTAAQDFATTTTRLQEALTAMDAKDPQSIHQAQETLKQCRLAYKHIEFFQEYFFPSAAIIYNGPAKVEVEEPYMEFHTPVGLQVIEALLFEKDVAAQQSALLQEVAVVQSSAQDLQAQLYGFTADDQQILESIRLELIRIYTLGLTGFDAPLLKSGVTESYEALQSMQQVLIPYVAQPTRYADSVTHYMNSSLQYLAAGTDFDTFDRLHFLTRHALPLQQYIGLLIREMQLELNTTDHVLNYDAPHLFSPGAINSHAFPNTGITPNASLVTLGKTLFHETALSGNNKVSCATCHQPAKHFTDGLATSVAFDGQSHVKRNAPTLLYAGLQHGQFWDARASSMEEQVKTVMLNPLEMNGNTTNTIRQLTGNQQYLKFFREAFPPAGDSLITLDKIAAAIAGYVRTLQPFNSAFDKYIAGNTTALSQQQINGFNLFMGKAQCGTCHFAPLFNGLVPPLYQLTELEVLGTPGNDQLNQPVADNDNGRYDIFPIEYYEQAFKTPTVRNVTATAPYMHNGAFATLEGVMDFYNKGGGLGLGLSVKHQTLSALPLNLSAQEIADVVSFLHALEDEGPY